jgi:hypothetical protein
MMEDFVLNYTCEVELYVIEDCLIYTLPVTWNLMWWDGRFPDLYLTCDVEFDVVGWKVF